MTERLRLLLHGRPVEVEIPPSEAGAILAQELALYEPTSHSPVLAFHLGNVAHGDGLRNPASHLELSSSFVAHYPGANVEYDFGENSSLIRIAIEPRPKRTRIENEATRWRSRQFTKPVQIIGQKFHELAAIPSLYFDPSYAVIHSAGIRLADGTATLIGGTGGVGKTTLEVEACLSGNATFLNDDIAVVTNAGVVHPNLAYPKIYAYNLRGNSELTARVLGKRTAADKLHWRLKHLRGQGAMLRRRCSPSDLYGDPGTSPAQLRRYLILARDDRSHIRIEELGASTAAALSVAVMQAEYNFFHEHLVWHAFNRRLGAREPVIDVKSVWDRWRALLEKVLESVECLAVYVPLSIGHREFVNQVMPIALRGR